MNHLNSSKIGAVAAAFAMAAGVVGAIPASAHAPTATAVADASSDAGACGAIQIGAGGSEIAAVRAATDCLKRAYADCKPAQLAVTWDTTDSRIDRIITVAQPDLNGCQILEQVTKTPKASGADSSDVYVCGVLTADANALTVHKCGLDGDVVVPTTASN